MKITECYWEDIKKTVKKINKSLYDVIENIPRKDRSVLYKIAYPYGDYITKTGQISLPSDNDAHKKLQKQFDYAETPLILQLTNQSEVFVETGDRIIPLNIFKPGDLYGLFEIAGAMTNCPISPVWHVTSGVRSAFMLPSVHDQVFHKRLANAFDLNATPPNSLLEQWKIFKAIVSAHDNQSWQTEVIVFPKSWFKKQNTLEWVSFNNYLLKETWRQAQIIKNYYGISVVWEYFAPAIKEAKPNNYILATLQHLINISSGTIPGFKPTNDDNTALPINLIQDAYANIYQLKYHPTIMIPHKLDLNTNNDFTFYSMAHPTLLEGSPSTRRKRSIVDEMRLMQRLLKEFIRVLQHSNNDNLFPYLQTLQYDFLHPTVNLNGSEDMHRLLSKDPYINPAYPHSVPGKKTFSINSPFLRGCIRIANKTE